MKDSISISKDVIIDALQPAIRDICESKGIEFISDINGQYNLLQKIIKSGQDLSYPKESEVKISNYFLQNDNMQVDEPEPFRVLKLFKIEVIPIQTKIRKAMPNIKRIDNDDEQLVFTTYGNFIDMRSYDPVTKKLVWHNIHTLSDNELIHSFDVKRTDEEIFFAAGSINGILYVIQLPSLERVIFKNHNSCIYDVKFNPLLDNNTVLTWCMDTTIRLFDYKEEIQLAIYQDYYNTWLYVKQVEWFEWGRRFLSVSNRCEQDIVLFWHDPNHPSHDPYKAVTEPNEHNVEDFFSEKPDQEQDDQIKTLRKPKPKCYPWYRMFKNINKTPILQVSVFGELYVLANIRSIFLIAPITSDTEFLEVHKSNLNHDFLEFHIDHENFIILVNTRNSILKANLYEVIKSGEYVFDLHEIYKKTRNRLEDSEVEKMSVFGSDVMLYNSQSELHILTSV